MLQRNVVAATKPDILIEINGDNYTVSTITSLKTIKISFTIGQQYEADPGTGKKSNVTAFLLKIFFSQKNKIALFDCFKAILFYFEIIKRVDKMTESRVQKSLNNQ
jgi:hypothetical protein